MKKKLAILAIGGALCASAILARAALEAAGLSLVVYAMFGAAYCVAGWNVLVSAARGIIRGRLFSEHFLMTVATAGALAIGAVTEAVAVMIFYKIGEILEDAAVDGSRRSIGRLLELRPDTARVRRNGGYAEVRPEEVAVGEEVSVRPGERVPLDAVVLTGEGLVDTAGFHGRARASPRDAGTGGACRLREHQCGLERKGLEARR